MTDSDGRDVAGIGTPADHDDTFRAMEEMRDSLRRLTDQAKHQNAKLRAVMEWRESGRLVGAESEKTGETDAR